MGTDRRNQARLVVGQDLNERVGLDRPRQRREPPHVDEHHRRVATLPMTGLEQGLGPGDPRRNARIEETPQVARRGTLGDGTMQDAARPDDRQRDHACHEGDRDDLVDLGPPEDRRRRHVDDEIPGHRHLAFAGHRRIGDQDEPPGRSRRARDHDVAGLHPQGSQRDEDEDIKQGWRLEVEGRGLAILDMEAPDQAQQQRHVGEDRSHLERCGDRPAAGEVELGDREPGIGRQRPGDRHEWRVRRRRAPRQRVEGDEDRAQHQLDDAHQDVAAMLLGADFPTHAFRNFLLPDAVAEDVDDQRAHRVPAGHSRLAVGLPMPLIGLKRIHRHGSHTSCAARPAVQCSAPLRRQRCKVRRIVDVANGRQFGPAYP